ncbi:E-selectin-like [Palaemon carinicauda]|uniref:E-selectin-like n=1 Tax=Palaemon carinicauda TaxID=392227 RepID=UPI0035B5CB77
MLLIEGIGEGSSGNRPLNVNMTCPEGLAFPDLSRLIEVTCVTGGNWTQSNDPEIDPVCQWITYQPPPAPPGSALNDSASHYWQGTVVNFTCPEGFQSSSGLSVTTLTFTGPNWTAADPSFECLIACGPPPTAVPPVTMTFTGSGVQGDLVKYKCLGGFAGSNSVDFITTCLQGVWSMTSVPKCQECNSTLPEAPAGVSVVPYVGVPAYGAVATYNCDGQFTDGASSLNVTCVDGEWSPQDILDCGYPCLDVPTATPVGATPQRYNVSIFEAVVTYTCAAGALIGGTVAQFNVTCKDGVWSPLVVPNCGEVISL